MNTQRLWAPWRVKYIKTTRRKGCIFCQAKKKARDYVIFKTRFSIVLLNIYPYNNGHIMLAPIRHIKDFSRMKQEEALDLFRALNKSIKLLDEVLKPQGYNIGINIAKSAGAGITRHLHIHIVPRWIGDTNFITTVYNTKVISQSLDELYRLLKNAESKINQRI